jgi:hypothetical protein
MSFLMEDLMSKPPWVSGPEELLRHGLRLLSDGSDINRRLAMISIDNAVELTIKTYLGLPKRITKLGIGRKRFQEINESFPQLLDALEEFCGDKLDGIDLGEIEWYHRIRNELYHNGNGLTIERGKAEIYSELAKTLFSNLFGCSLDISGEGETAHILGSFMSNWVTIEKSLKALYEKSEKTKTDEDVKNAAYLGLREAVLGLNGLIDKNTVKEIESIREIRNKVIHAQEDVSILSESNALNRSELIAQKLSKLL